MKIGTEIYRASDPSSAVPAVIEFKRLYAVGFPTTLFEFEVTVHVDRDENGVADETLEVGHLDMTKKFAATEAQLSFVDARLTGTGNLMQAIRSFVKTQVTAHNEAVNPGSGASTTFTDWDTDTV